METNEGIMKYYNFAATSDQENHECNKKKRMGAVLGDRAPHRVQFTPLVQFLLPRLHVGILDSVPFLRTGPEIGKYQHLQLTATS